MPEKIYVFDDTIIKALKPLEQYFTKRKYAKDTIQQYCNYAGLFLQWLTNNALEPETLNYEELKNFIFQLKKEKSDKYINRMIIAIAHYYKCLDLGFNPAMGLRVRGTDRNLKNYFIEYETLEQLYKLYSTADHRAKRNKVILGLLIYQGLTSGELHQLKPSNVDLEATQIYIPGSKQSNGRNVLLQANQLLLLKEYLEIIRPEMLAAIANNASSIQQYRKPKQAHPEIKEQLFFSIVGNANIKSSLYQLFRSIEKVYPKITSAKVIRSTVITHWLRHHDVRKVQYMAGHRYVSSTEKYNAFNLQDLEESLRNYHPLK